MENQVHSAPKSQSEIVTALRERAANNDVFNAICYIFAKRQRARRQVTVSALKQAMEVEGADFTTQQYIETLKFLAQLGLGKEKVNTNGEFVGLGEIQTTLQSIGQAAAAKRPDLKRLKPQPKGPKFIDLTKPEVLPPTIIETKKHVLRKASDEKKAEIARAQAAKERIYTVYIVLYQNGQKTVLEGDLIKGSDLGEFMANYRTLVDGKKTNN